MIYPTFGASVTEPDPDYARLGACVRRAREACALKRLTVAAFIDSRTEEAIYQMEHGIRQFPVAKLFRAALDTDADAQRFREAVICELSEAWGVEDRDGIARQLRAVNVTFGKRMAKAALKTTSGAHKEVA